MKYLKIHILFLIMQLSQIITTLKFDFLSIIHVQMSGTTNVCREDA